MLPYKHVKVLATLKVCITCWYLTFSCILKMQSICKEDSNTNNILYGRVFHKISFTTNPSGYSNAVEGNDLYCSRI